MSSGKILLGIVTAVAAGVVVGMLIAPAKGSVTRKRLSRRGIGYVEELNDSFADFTDTLSEGYDSIKKNTMDLAAKGKEKTVLFAGSKHSK